MITRKRFAAAGALTLALGSMAVLTPAMAQRYPRPVRPIVNRDRDSRIQDLRENEKIRRAILSLKDAERSLSDTRSGYKDFGGRRARALTLTREAIREAERAIDYNNR